jgi:phosphoribosylaminoimidazole-succinocarboxamide synthase
MSRGIVNEEQQTVPLTNPTPLLHVHKVDVLRPTHDGTDYQYDVYQSRPSNALVPLEVIFRFGVPNGSSLMKRVNNATYLAELGLTEKPNFGDTFPQPIIEFSTKLESTDTYIPFAKAQQIAGLTDQEARNLKELVYILSLRLKDLFATSDLFLWDGKFEFAFSKERDEQGNRKFVLVDSIGPDELRLTYDGVQLSKECLRTPYRGSAWHSGMDQAKNIAKERGERDWKRICTEELGLSPQPLAPQFIEQMAQLYKALSNAMSVQLYNQKIFSDGWSLAQVADTLRTST